MSNVVRIGDKDSRNNVLVEGSGNVTANNKSVSRIGDKDSNEDVMVDGSANVFAGDDIDIDIPSIAVVIDADEDDVTDPGSGEKIFAEAVASGVISQREATVNFYEPTGESSGTGEDPLEKIPPPAGPLSKDCNNIEAIFNPLPPGEGESPSPIPSGDDIDEVVLVNEFTIGTLTRKPNVVFDNPLRGPAGGLSIGEIACNLKLLTINCIIPIKNKYPNAIVTNTWRPFKGNPRSQHPKGQAADIQFRGVSKAAYYDIAIWIRENVTYDQLLLEYKTTGSGLPWIHISFDKDKSRAQILTLLNDKTYSQGLTQLA
jgi:hypothetical protein